MYAEIKDNSIYSYCDHQYRDYTYIDISFSDFELNKKKYKKDTLGLIVLDELTNLPIDISDTAEFKTSKAYLEEQLYSYQLELSALDIKRIRALAEPGVKEVITNEDETTTEITWLAYYNTLIAELRTKTQDALALLNN
jgi:hypothetical protein